MKIHETLNWIIAQGPRTGRYGLDRMEFLLEELENPEKEYACVLIGGTNGKGSVTSILESILINCQEYQIGTFTSPHLLDLRERIRIQGTPLENKYWLQGVKALRPIIKLMKKEESIGPAGFFETVTALAFWAFRETERDLVLLEVGLGGRFDATNTSDPEISVITNIGTDHQIYLGDSKLAIAKEKLGIIRKKKPLITNEKSEEILKEFESTCKNKKTDLIKVKQNEFFEIIESHKDGHTIKTIFSDEEIFFPMPGDHQLENLATALKVVAQLKQHGFEISDDSITQGLKDVIWPGRLQWIKGKPSFLLDGAHNPEGLECLLKYMKKFPPEEPVNIIFGTLQDKPYLEMAQKLLSIGQKLFFVPPSCGRGISKEDFDKLDNNIKEKCQWEPSIENAIEKAKANAGTVLITGSLYLLADALKLIKPNV